MMVHAENDDMIRWIAKRLLERGHGAPNFHGVAHDALAEAEATNRIIMLSRLLGAPVLIVHVSSPEATERDPRRADPRRADLRRDLPAVPVAHRRRHRQARPRRREVVLQPAAARRGGAGGDLGRACSNGTFQVYSSDHAPYRFDETARCRAATRPRSRRWPTAFPGIELRLPILFSEGVLKKRLTINQFVALTATNHARMYGLYPRKGTIAVGSDADIAIWDPEIEKRIDYSMMHDAVGYTPYEGHVYKGWPEIVLSRGRIVVEDDQLKSRARIRPVPRARRARPGRHRHHGRRTRAPTKEIHPWLDTSRSPRPSSGRSTRPTPAPPPFPRLKRLLHEAHAMGAKFVVFPELALTTFFPRWWMDDQARGRRAVLRAQHALEGHAAAVRRGEEARHRLLHRLRRAHARGAALQHRDPGRARRLDRRQVPQDPPAGPRRPQAQGRLPAPGEEVLRGRRPRLPRLAVSWTRSPAC